MKTSSISRQFQLTTKRIFRIMTIITFILGVIIGMNGCEKENCKEQKDNDCICTMEYAPVCGCNDKTYGNACEAECHGITDYVKGECNNNE